MLAFCITLGLLWVPYWLGFEFSSLTLFFVAMMNFALLQFLGFIVLEVGVFRLFKWLLLLATLGVLGALFPPFLLVLLALSIFWWIRFFVKMLKMLLYLLLSFPYYALLLPNLPFVNQNPSPYWFWLYAFFTLCLAFWISKNKSVGQSLLRLSFVVGTVPNLYLYLRFFSGGEEEDSLEGELDPIVIPEENVPENSES